MAMKNKAVFHRTTLPGYRAKVLMAKKNYKREEINLYFPSAWMKFFKGKL